MSTYTASDVIDRFKVSLLDDGRVWLDQPRLALGLSRADAVRLRDDLSALLDGAEAAK